MRTAMSYRLAGDVRVIESPHSDFNTFGVDVSASMLSTSYYRGGIELRAGESVRDGRLAPSNAER